MQYHDIRPARFLARPNRFIALVWREGTLERVHVKNTGRCAELLRPGVRVWLEYSTNPARSTPCAASTAAPKAGWQKSCVSQAPTYCSRPKGFCMRVWKVCWSV